MPLYTTQGIFVYRGTEVNKQHIVQWPEVQHGQQKNILLLEKFWMILGIFCTKRVHFASLLEHYQCFLRDDVCLIFAMGIISRHQSTLYFHYIIYIIFIIYWVGLGRL